jgi:hypothetical protein
LQRLALRLIVAAALPTGCGYDATMQPTMRLFDEGKFAAASAEVAPLLAEHSLQPASPGGAAPSPINGVVFGLDAGAIQQAAGQYAASMATLQSVWDEIAPYLDDKPDTRITEEVAAALTNQTVRAYRGTCAERIMLDTYQALNHFALGQPEKAAVELRRAELWQRDAIEKNQARIDRETKAFEAAGRRDGVDTARIRDDPVFKAQFDERFGTLREMRGYADYEIPYATCLRGVNRLATGEFEQARTAFKRVAEMLEGSAAAAALRDVALAADAADGAPLAPCVFVFVEAGRAPSLKQVRIDIPLFIVGVQNVPYVGAAFPSLVMHDQPTVTGFTVAADGAAATGALLTDMDAVVAADFNRRLPAIVVATLVSSATKAAATYGLQQGMGDWGSILGVAYQVAMNSADLRCWLTLPKRVLWARVDRPASGELSVALSDGRTVGPVALAAGAVSVVRIRTASAGTEPAVLTFSIPAPG